MCMTGAVEIATAFIKNIFHSMSKYCIHMGILDTRDKGMDKVPTLMELIIYLEFTLVEI